MTDRTASEVGQSDVSSRRLQARDVLTSLVRGAPAIAICAVLAVGIALLYSALSSPKYQATAVLYVTSGSDDNSQAAYQGSLASQQRVASYAKLATSQAVLEKAVSGSKLPISVATAGSEVTASSTSDTVLLNISATARSGSDAAALANAVAAAMSNYVSTLETPSPGAEPLAKLTVVTKAQLNAPQVSPKTLRNVIIALLFGLLVGMLLVLARARFTDRIVLVDDLPPALEMPLLGQIPEDRTFQRSPVVDFAKGGSGSAEAFRKIRTNLGFIGVDNPAKVILVSSPVAAEGKTTVAINLAASLVENGAKVALIDGDLRKPRIGERLGVVGAAGFTSYLRGDAELNDLIQPGSPSGLWVLSAGPLPPNPAELLGTDRASSALRELSSAFDYVLIDSPPILPVADACVLARCADGVILVARANKTKRRQLVEAVNQVGASGATLVGLVLSGARVNKSEYGYYGADMGKR